MKGAPIVSLKKKNSTSTFQLLACRKLWTPTQCIMITGASVVHVNGTGMQFQLHLKADANQKQKKHFLFQSIM